MKNFIRGPGPRNDENTSLHPVGVHDRALLGECLMPHGSKWLPIDENPRQTFPLRYHDQIPLAAVTGKYLPKVSTDRKNAIAGIPLVAMKFQDSTRHVLLISSFTQVKATAVSIVCSPP